MLSVIDTATRGACKAGESTLTLAQPAPPSPKVVTGSVDADGTMTDENGGLSVTVLDQGLYAVTYDGFNSSHPGIVTLIATSSYSAAASTIPGFPRMTPASRVRSAGRRRLESSSNQSDTTDPRRRSTSTSTSRRQRGSWPVPSTTTGR